MEEVEQTVRNLKRLQELQGAIAAVNRDLAKGPAMIAEIEATLASARTALVAARAEIEAGVKARRVFERDIEDVKVKISRYQDQLMAVKTNEQYRALTHEIETERKRVETSEDKILVSMEHADEVAAVVRDKQGILDREQARVSRESAVVERECARFTEELATLHKERDAIIGLLPKPAYALFKRIADLRGGVALSIVADGETCGGCRMRCLPQAVEEARLFARIVQCDMCSRILFAPPFARPSAITSAPAALVPVDDDLGS